MAIQLLGKPQGEIPQRLLNACMEIHMGTPAEKAANAAYMADALAKALTRHGLTLAVTTDIRTVSQGFVLPDIVQDEGGANNNQTEAQRIGAAVSQFMATASERIAADGLVLMQKKRRPAISQTPGVDLTLALSVYAPGLTQQQAITQTKGKAKN